MTQHEYVFVAISIILGLAITRLLGHMGGLIRAHKRIKFHWATALWALSIMLFALQMWWVGWALRNFEQWAIVDFLFLVAGTIFVYGAAELALPVEDYDLENDLELNFLDHSQSLGRVSAAFMVAYFAVGPYYNIRLLGNAATPSIVLAGLGALLALGIVVKPSWFTPLTVITTVYAVSVLILTA
ncbi:hypothetical protein [Congregibacter litoralis]|uniref:Uncharacterized protein n=1 Tax=Congregibacter litoralis KT71 TaxID=314285 RepID=A4ADC4_9GAMM|nr:hypothetical protein [Congregibacter litoralis]EAQ96048.1 hypothetical protein KT71_12935 [Congregibacter litoralis KT71]